MNALLFNWAIALGAWALGGPLWGALVFLAVALVRVSLDAQILRRQNEELCARLVAQEPFGSDDYQPEPEAPPHSDTRARAGAIARTRMASS